MYSDFTEDYSDERADLSQALWQQLEPQLAEVGGAMSLLELVGGFLERTSELTPAEQATIIQSAIRHGRPENFNFGSFARTLTGLVQTGAALVGAGAQAFGGNNRTSRQVALWANRIGQGAGMVNTLVTGLTGPGGRRTAGRRPPARRGAPARAPVRRAPAPRAQPPARPPAARPAPARGGPQRGGAPLNATALLQTVMGNPQLQQMLRQALLTGRSGRREVVVEVPSPRTGRSRAVTLPVAAVVNVIRELSEQSLAEFDGYASEDSAVPEYLLSEEGEYLVDPSDRSQRAELALQYLRAAAEAELYGAVEPRFGAENSMPTDFFEDWGE